MKPSEMVQKWFNYAEGDAESWGGRLGEDEYKTKDKIIAFLTGIEGLRLGDRLAVISKSLVSGNEIVTYLNNMIDSLEQREDQCPPKDLF